MELSGTLGKDILVWLIGVGGFNQLDKHKTIGGDILVDEHLKVTEVFGIRGLGSLSCKVMLLDDVKLSILEGLFAMVPYLSHILSAWKQHSDELVEVDVGWVVHCHDEL